MMSTGAYQYLGATPAVWAASAVRPERSDHRPWLCSSLARSGGIAKQDQSGIIWGRRREWRWMSESGVKNAVARNVFRPDELQQWHRNWNDTPNGRSCDSIKYRN
jgi:type IV secretory pathway TraG/TraD family ATPase VirD4